MNPAARLLLARPGRLDRRGVAVCVGLQVALAVAMALTHRAFGPLQQSAPEHLGVLGYLGHNLAVFALWSAGAATLGLASLVLSGVASASTGLVVGATVDQHGWSALLYLGHAVLEVPALAIALWIALRPAALLAAGSVSDRVAERGLLRQALRSLVPLVLTGAVLLVLAAVWEAAVAPPW